MDKLAVRGGIPEGPVISVAGEAVTGERRRVLLKKMDALFFGRRFRRIEIKRRRGRRRARAREKVS